MKNRVFGFCFIASLVFSLNDKGYAQQRRIDTLPTSTGCYRQPVTPISQVLTLHSDMPLDCILGYVYFDSLCRSLQSSHQADSLISLITSWDTMRVFMRFLYRMAEYDADLYKEYLYGAGYLNPAYNVYPGTIEFKFWQHMNNVLGPRNKLNYLTMVPVILHIRVLGVGASYDSMTDYPVSPQPRKCVQATVIDTIKGIHWRIGDCGQYLQGKQVTPQDGPACINLDFSPVSPKSYARSDMLPVTPADSGTNPPFVCDSCYGNNAFEVGKEYIVFLEDGFLDYNGTYSFYEYVPYNTYNDEGGIFPIDSSGNVLSQDNYFGYGTSVPLPTFEADLRADIWSIISH